MAKFENKTVWITGASSGIGEACAYLFAIEKANLILTATRTNALKIIQEKCIGLGAQCKILPFDLASIENIPVLVANAFNCFGSIDILYNNAGISQRGLTADTLFEVDKKIMDINFFAPVLITKLVLPEMLKRKAGTIAVTSSIAGKFGFPLRSAYSASKHALYGFFETLQAEYYDQNIRVVMICPGFVNTNISMNALDNDGKRHANLDSGQAGGISAEKAAKKIVNGIYSQKQEVLTGGKELIMVYIKRFLPTLSRFLARKIKST
ncbi:MAG: SDR family oxidoreductase [Paludibacter sp.]|nr:SDR family oxidoreductase [Paludibacter sp.]